MFNPVVLSPSTLTSPYVAFPVQVILLLAFPQLATEIFTGKPKSTTISLIPGNRVAINCAFALAVPPYFPELYCDW